MPYVAQVITVADFHPRHCHTFAFATSKGAIRMADLRASALLDNSCKVYEEVCPLMLCLPTFLQIPTEVWLCFEHPTLYNV